jgi:ribosomal protein S18 acetylase RimI-like enzyme
MGKRDRLDQYREIDGPDHIFDEIDVSSSILFENNQAASLTLPNCPEPAGSRVILRRAAISDSRFIGRLSRDVFTIYGPYEDIISGWFRREKGITTLIACQDDVRIGFAMLGEPGSRYDLQDASELLGIAVEPDKQGKGIGKMLLRAIDATSVHLGIKWLLLHTAANNKPARRLYEKTGYRLLELKRNFYPEGQDAIVMYKEVQRLS